MSKHAVSIFHAFAFGFFGFFVQTAAAQDDRLPNLREHYLETPFSCANHEEETDSCVQIGSYELNGSGDLVEIDEWSVNVNNASYNIRIRSVMVDQGSALCYNRANQQVFVRNDAGLTDIATMLLESRYVSYFRNRENACFEMVLTDTEGEYLVRTIGSDTGEITTGNRIWTMMTEKRNLRDMPPTPSAGSNESD